MYFKVLCDILFFIMYINMQVDCIISMNIQIIIKNTLVGYWNSGIKIHIIKLQAPILLCRLQS